MCWKWNGKLTGRLVDQPLGRYLRRRREKAGCCWRCATLMGITPEQAIAMGDGANDLPMMGAAGLSVAYHAKPTVREQAMVSITLAAWTARWKCCGPEAWTARTWQRPPGPPSGGAPALGANQPYPDGGAAPTMSALPTLHRRERHVANQIPARREPHAPPLVQHHGRPAHAAGAAAASRAPCSRSARTTWRRCSRWNSSCRK